MAVSDLVMTNFSISSFVVIFDEKKRVLLSHRRDQDIWNLPGGGMEIGELPPEAVIRETFEETGLKIKVKRLWEAAPQRASLCVFRKSGWR